MVDVRLGTGAEGGFVVEMNQRVQEEYGWLRCWMTADESLEVSGQLGQETFQLVGAMEVREDCPARAKG